MSLNAHRTIGFRIARDWRSARRSLVDPRGLVTPFFDGWSLDGWVVPHWNVPPAAGQLIAPAPCTGVPS